MESIRVRWIRWTPSERLSNPTERLMTIFQVSYEQKLHMCDGIYSCPMESIGTTLHPFLRIDEIFPSVLRTETRHVRWNPFLSDGTPTISVLFTDGLPVFRWKADDVRWSLIDSIGQPSKGLTDSLGLGL